MSKSKMTWISAISSIEVVTLWHTRVRNDNSVGEIVISEVLTIYVHVYDVRFDIKFATQLTFVINSSTSVGIRFVYHII